MITYMRLTAKRRYFLLAFVGFRCETCKKKFKDNELEVHRKNQNLGYSLGNIQIACKKTCHPIFSSAQRIAKGTQG